MALVAFPASVASNVVELSGRDWRSAVNVRLFGRIVRRVSEGTMDPLSELLSVFELKTHMAGGFDGAGEWSIAYPECEGIKCCAVVSGGFWLIFNSESDPVRIEAGDCFLLPSGLPFRLATDIRLVPVDANISLDKPLNGGIRTWNGGGECFSVCGWFSFTGTHSRMLLDELPPIVHIRCESGKAQLRWYLERMMQELREPRPGAALVAQQLATTILLQALRLHLESGLNAKAGWLSAMVDRNLRGAITSIHKDPAHGWTLPELAERSGMSRSIFASKFKTTVGTSPIEYLTRWRMLLAGHKLTTSSASISAIALSLGYRSESTFRTAFRKIMDCSPLQYRNGRNESSRRKLTSLSRH